MDRRIRKNKKSYTIYDMYKPFVDENIDVEVSYSDFKAVLDSCNKFILETLQNSSEGFKMPYGLGYLIIVKYLPKEYSGNSLSYDYKTSKQLNKKIYYLNEHSSGYKYRLYWSKVPKTFSDRYKYQLMFTRENKRNLAKLIFKHKDYINVNDLQVYKM